ncbi:MAG: hypothetical protein AAF512_17735 [Pseudomonadota bacterium]
MPKLTGMQTIDVPGGGNFQFSAVRPDLLGAVEYTLVTIVVDVTWSVTEFKDELLDTLKSVIRACRHSPRADNLMVRLLHFNTKRNEIHGFIPLNQINPDDYKPLHCEGMTALYDAVYDAIGATNTYAQNLVAQDFDVNAAVFIITDGEDNSSKITPAKIADQVRRASREECLESLLTVLIGVNAQSAGASAHLQIFKDEAELSQFVDVADAGPDNLAKLGAFVSRSISMQSQALGMGNSPQSLSF